MSTISNGLFPFIQQRISIMPSDFLYCLSIILPNRRLHVQTFMGTNKLCNIPFLCMVSLPVATCSHRRSILFSLLICARDVMACLFVVDKWESRYKKVSSITQRNSKSLIRYFFLVAPKIRIILLNHVLSVFTRTSSCSKISILHVTLDATWNFTSY